MDVRLLSWGGENYRSWSSVLVEPPSSGVVIVKGRHLETKTTSGVGKTSLLAAISGVLGCGPPATKAKTWGAKRYQLFGTFQVGGEIAAISRGGRTKLQLGGTELEGALAEEKLTYIFGHPKVLGPLIWRQQRKRGHFFARTAGERALFLAEVLDLIRFERMGRAADSTKSKIEIEAEYLRRELCAAQVVASQPRLVVPPPTEVAPLMQLEAEVAVLEREYALSQRAHDDIVASRSQQQKQLDAIRSARSKLEASVTRLIQSKSLAEGVCPTCGAAVRSQVSASEVSELLESARQNLDLILEAERDFAMPPPPPRPSQPSRLGAARQELAQRKDAATRAATDRGRSIAAAEAREAAIAEAGRQVEQLKSRAADADRRLALEADLAAWEKSWRISFAAELLADLTSETNAILARIPNTSSVTVSFSPRETSSGSQEIADIVMIDGFEREDGLSDGQQSSVELACDLALRSVVGGRCSVRPAWVVLDEPFEGMGLSDREAFLDWMEEQGDLFLVVDTHSREFSEAFERQGIGVEMAAGASRMVSAEERASW